MLKRKLQHFGHLIQRTDSLEKTLMLGKIEGRRRRGTMGNEMVGWHHQLNGHEFGWTPGVGDGQGGLVCCDSWGCKQSDTTERLNWTDFYMMLLCFLSKHAKLKFEYFPSFNNDQLFFKIMTHIFSPIECNALLLPLSLSILIFICTLRTSYVTFSHYPLSTSL